MKQTTALVGPRGWAALVLAGGAAFAAPFLRSPHASNPAAVTSNTTNPDFSPNSWPEFREQHLAPPATDQASDLSTADWQELSKLQAVSAKPRKVSGKLPSTKHDPLAPTLPSWADQGRRIDHVVDAAVRGEPLEQNPSMSEVEIQPLRPWVNPSVQNTQGPNAISALANTLPAISADPFAGWTSSTPEVHTLASQLPTKHFEDQPKLWPDQKLRVDDLATSMRPGISAIVQDTRGTAPDRYSPASELSSLVNTTSPASSSLGVSHDQANPRVGLSSATKRESMPLAPMSSPMVSPPLIQPSPSISPPKEEPVRQRHFIRQPPKRA